MARRPPLAIFALFLALPGTAAPQTDPAALRVGVGKADLTWRVGAAITAAVTGQLPNVAGQTFPTTSSASPA